ncbi:MAG: HK97 family phage prohead protease [Caulobacteraceae bacterium]|nr:HK97 family phage prohead protease [Caulobacteraceae bacterium]
MSYIITDIDGTLTTTGDTPNQPYIDWLNEQVMSGEEQVIVVSARSIDRLQETRAWLQENKVAGIEAVHLNDFEGTPFATGLAFKEYKYKLLIEEFGLDNIEMAVDNDPDVRAMARELGLEAMTPGEAIASTQDVTEEQNAVRAQVDVPAYIQAAADKGLAYYAEGLGGDGLVEQTISDARDLAGGSVSEEKARRMIAWIARHRVDWEGVPQNSDESNENFPGPGAVAAYLWGVNPTQPDGADRVVRWAEGIVAALEDREIIDLKELETRALPMGDFTVTDGEDGQKTFTGYAALFNVPSDGMQFTEIIAPNAFTRTLKRVADGKKMISFLFGHDETRALATTASGRLTLTEDARGLKVEAKLDPADPDAASVISKLTHEARSMGMSFGFSIPKSGDVWEENIRTLNEINLFEVSVLSAGQTPAYPATIGLTAVRKLSAIKIGVDGDRLMNTLENIKSANPLTADDLQVIDQVRERLAPKPVGVDPSVALAMLQTKRLMDQEL